MDQTNVEHNTNTNDEKVEEKVTRDQMKIVNAITNCYRVV